MLKEHEGPRKGLVGWRDPAYGNEGHVAIQDVGLHHDAFLDDFQLYCEGVEVDGLRVGWCPRPWGYRLATFMKDDLVLFTETRSRLRYCCSLVLQLWFV